MATVCDQKKWNCHNCVCQFDTRGQSDAHQRKEHQKPSTAAFGGMTVQRSSDGKFVCECDKDYLTLQSLKRHKRSCTSQFLAMQTVMEDEEGMSKRVRVRG